MADLLQQALGFEKTNTPAGAKPPTQATQPAQPTQPTQQYSGDAAKLSQFVDQLNGATPTAEYPSKPDSIADQIAAMPNGDKLSGFEKWVYKKLPGFTQSRVGQALAAFSESPVGKSLGILDVGAEAAERVLGLAAQWRDRQPGDEFSLKDAWAAGSMFYDTVRLPELYKDANGNTRLRAESNMPGAYALTEARKLLQEGKTLDEVRDTLYGNMGALALRGQLRDTLGHIVADPLNWALGAVKPIEKLHALRNLALTTKTDVEFASSVAKELRVAGKLDDALKVEQAIAQAEKEGKALNRLDKFAIMLTGGTPYTQDVTKMGAVGKTLSKLNPFALRPEARASEFLDMVAANMGEYVIRPNWEKDPMEVVNAISSAARGSIGGEWGHLASTRQGRTVQALFSQADAAMKDLGSEWQLYSKERGALEVMARALKSDETKLWKLAAENPEVFMQRIVQAAQQPGGEELLQALQKGDINPQIIDNISKIDGTTIPLTKEQFFTKALVTVQDLAMQQSILQFGIKEKGILTKWSDALKAWETLPFIKANPANMVRNVVNNDVTLVGRGLFGTMTRGAIDNFWKDKWVPPQMKRAFTFAGEGEFDAGKATQRLVDILEGKGETLPQKIKAAAGRVDLKAADFSKYSQEFEARASLRASTNAWIEFFDKYWNGRTGFTSVSKYLDPDTLDEISKVDPNLARTLDEVAQTAGGDAKKFSELMQTNLEHNFTTVLKNTEDRLGFKVDDVLGPELTQALRDGLPGAIEKGNVKEFVNGLRSQMEAHVDDMFNRHLENLPGIVAAQVQAGGPAQFNRIFGKALDELWAGNTEHAIRMSTINELMDYAKRTDDYTKVGELWNQIMKDGENHFGRVWKKMEAYQNGLEEGAKAAGLKLPGEVKSSFSDIGKGWKDFFEFRNTEYKKFFDAKLSGKEYTKTLEQLQGEIETRFRKIAANEDAAYQKIDDAMASMIPDRQMRGMYMRYRDEAARLREADRAATQKFYAELRQADAKDAPDMWQQYWSDKVARLEQMRQLDLQGSSAIQGDANAIQQFTGAMDQGQAADNIYGLASQYGISSTSEAGARNDRRILTTVNKYLKDNPNVTPTMLVDNARLPDEVKTAYKAYDEALTQLESARKGATLEAGDAGKQALKQAKQASKEARAAYEQALQANHIDEKMIQKLVNKKQFMNVDAIPLEIAQQAFEARTGEKTAQIAGKAQELGFIPDAEKIFKDPMPIETGLSELNYGRSYAAMDALTEEAIAQANVKSKRLADLPVDVQKKVMQWMDRVNDESAGFRSAATQYSAFRRDSALLNYNRRTNFDNWVGHIAPFSFWTTHSVLNWAVHSIDRPAMLANYYRARKLFETAGLPDQNVPSRLKGQIRVTMPFSPDWMGDTFFSPSRFLLPFDAWASPWEQAQTSKISAQGKTEKTLQDMLEQGVIDERQYKEAIDTKAGDAWDIASQKVQEGGDNYDAMDFVNMTMTPHAPLMWAYNSLRGQPNEIGPFTPMTRTVKNFATMMGVKDWSNSPYNIEGRIRKQMGLPAYDKWDDYRVGRQISNLAADGTYSIDEIRGAMELAAQVEAGQITSADAVQQSNVYEEATYRANQEYAGGPAGTILGLLGVPIKSYPTGEQKQRELADQFSAAYKKYDAGDVDALTNFFDAHPEYESRLALFKKPEERLKSFMTDNIWARWNDLPKVSQDEIKDQLGDNFANNFINKETRNYDAITPEQMQIWLKLMGGKQVGTLSATAETLAEFNQLKLTDPETAWRAQTFYDMRNQLHPDWYKMQNEYYALPEKDRKAYLNKNPDLRAYWTDRRNWMNSNPDLVRFLTDDPKQLKQFENKKRNPQVAVPNAQEIAASISQPNMELIQEWSNGQTLPASTDALLTQLAAQYGVSKRDLLGILTGK